MGLSFFTAELALGLLSGISMPSGFIKTIEQKQRNFFRDAETSRAGISGLIYGNVDFLAIRRAIRRCSTGGGTGSHRNPTL